MNQSIIRRAALACTFATLALTSAGAWAQATLNFNDSNCSYFTLTPAAGPSPQTLNCVVNAPPVCNVTGATTATIGQPLNLSASCSPAATRWTWTGWTGAAACTTQACQDPGAGYTNGQIVPYTVTGGNGSGTGPSSTTFNVTWTNTPPQAPGSCSISGAPSGNQTAGVMVTLTMNCTTGGTAAANGYVWTGAGAAGTTQSVGPFAVNATTTFTATASNAGGVSPAAQAVVTIGGGGGNISCPGFNNTHVVVIPWGPPGSSQQVQTGGAWGANDAYLIQFTTPAGTATSIGSISATEYQSGPFIMATKLSATACDFTNPGVSQSPSTYFEVTNIVGQNLLQPNTTYYWNMKHYQSGGGQAIIILTQPSGL